MSSILRRVWQRFMKPTYLVGRDLEGNMYYEFPNTNGGRPRRTIQYKQRDNMWSYVANGKRLPVQWNAWLTHTRPSAPSIEELQDDLARQRRVQMNAAILEARDKKECEQVTCLARPSSGSRLHVPEPRLETKAERERSDHPTNVSTSVDNGPIPTGDLWREANKGSDEIQTWTPVVRQR